MNLSIYKVHVPITSQEQANRMKQLCIDNGLPIWDDEISFKMVNVDNYFGYSVYQKQFAVWGSYFEGETQVTEQQFIELLKNHK